MAEWSFDMSKAPRGSYRVIPAGQKGQGARKVFERAEIVAAGKCGVVTVTYYIPEQRRWSMFAHGEQPVAWAPFNGPRTVAGPNGKPRRVLDLPDHPGAQVAA